ncbi:DUF397 domain-containing protein [Streptomyces sp. NPDC057445]|uniref:DUF397 domain-containing protein n=1 Tax=Streptomyces sp. NPDC057445 TaxID=3346136 RepID=UPI0036956B19
MNTHRNHQSSTDVAPESAWFKSSYSSDGTGNCVEAAYLAPGVGIRDSKDKKSPALVFPKSSWAAFVAGVRSGEFDAHA